MKKKALLLLVLLGVSLGYGIVCSLLDHFVLQSDDAFCVFLYPSVYIGEGVSTLFLLLVAGLLSLSLFPFIPNGFIYKLYKPPQHFSVRS